MKHTTLILLSLLAFNALAQTTEGEDKLRKQTTDTIKGWRKGGVISINLSQTSLNNWAAGGQNSISINSLLSVFANYKKGNSVWDNSLDVGYGVLQQGENDKFLKTDDKIDLLSKYGQKASKSWYYAGLLNFKTQMTPGYNYPNDSIKISNLLAPGYLLGALGMDYKPNKYFSMFMAPLTAKVTMVHDPLLANVGAFGVEPAVLDSAGNILTKGKTILGEFGGYVRIIYSRNDFKPEALKNISLTTKIDLFSNYIHSPDHVDISWENLIAMKVNKYISVTLTTQILYDHDITINVDTNEDGVIDESGPRTQFKEILGVGITYKF